MILRLDKAKLSSHTWLLYAKQLKDRVEHHLSEEENKFFQVAGKLFSEIQKKDMAEKYRKEINKRRKLQVERRHLSI
jgi:hemerythrin-like domain-containing protein